jgi:erythronate-4-phosphate dehydrogenase
MKPTFRLLADKHIYLLRESIPDSIELSTFDPDLGLPTDAGDCDALLVRTVTKVNAKSLRETQNLKWVGTASAGYDHIDIPWLSEKGIAVGSAAGCNAQAVAEYVLTTAIYAAQKRGWRFADKRLGIVGVGFVGTAVANLAHELGIQVVTYDPPRSLREPDFYTATLDDVLDCEILTLHTPLTETGKWMTKGWLDSNKLFSRNRTLLIQASRGGVAEEDAVISALNGGYLDDAIIDVWQHEPAVNETLLEMSIVGTPHIAGYSNRSKRQATELAVAHMMMSLESGKTSMPDDVVRPKLYTDVTPKSSIDEILDIGGELLPSRLVDDYLDHDRSLRASIKLPTSEERLREFRHLRTKLPYRDEYRDTSRQIFPSSAWPLLDLFRDF